MSKTILVAVLAAFAAFAPLAASQAADALKASPIIFESKHLDLTKQGDEIVYDFSSKPSDERLGGPGFKDTITLKITGIKDDKREVEMQIYTGERARELQKMSELTINPVFIVAMQQSMSMLAKLTGGEFNYLKVAFTKVLDKQSMEPIKIDYKGEQHDAYRISVTPFTDDPNVARMRGYQASTFSMILSPTVPGEFVETVSNLKSTQEGSVAFEDRTAIAGFGGVK